MHPPCTDLVCAIPIARMRHLYRLDEVERRLTRLAPKDHEQLRATYERMLEKGPERHPFQGDRPEALRSRAVEK